MRILLYNFVQPEEPGAGGVGVYLNNLAKALAVDNEVILLSSGDRYSPRQRAPRLECSEDIYRRAVIVNSPVIAPAAYSFNDPETYLDSQAIDPLVDALYQQYGDIDVFHFHNIEGLTASFFQSLRRKYAAAKMIYSVHNYHPICPRVSLWYQDRVVCTDYQDGVACINCLAPVFDQNYIRNRRRLTWMEKKNPALMAVAAPFLGLAKFGRRRMMKARQQAVVVEQAVPDGSGPPAASFARFRQTNIALFDTVFDHVLAVSERTAKVIIDRGVSAEKVSVSYIGTAHKQNYLNSRKIVDLGEGLHLGYIGYMGTDKGFNFLLECLERMPAELARTVAVTIAARNTFPERRARMERLAPRLRALHYYDGYTHDNLDTVLSGVNIGLIPVLWEDNLPQTAIELVSRGIPILTSDRGGAQEIANNSDFVFHAGRHDDFLDRIYRISNGNLPLSAFWQGEMRVFSMEEHVGDLMAYYS